MRTYVIRIYRQDLDNQENMVGRIEDVESGDERTFNTTTELLDVIKGVGGMTGKEPRIAGSK